MNNEAVKQNLAHVARNHVDSLFHLGVCGNSISSKLRFYRITIAHRHSSDVDNAHVQRQLKRSRCAVRVTLRCHPETSS
jgi:hypothetical protein